MSWGVFRSCLCKFEHQVTEKQLTNFKTGGKRKCSLPIGAEARLGNWSNLADKKTTMQGQKKIRGNWVSLGKEEEGRKQW